MVLKIAVDSGCGSAASPRSMSDEHADGADQVLVHRVVVVHVELHHRHDPAELRHEAAEHAGLVHAPQRRLGVAAPSTACPGRCGWPPDRCAACRRSAAASGAAAARRRDGRRRRSRSALAKKRMRLTGSRLNTSGVGDVEAAVVDAEIAGRADAAARAPAQRIEQAREARRRLDLLASRAPSTGWWSGRRRPWRPGSSAS